MAHNFPPSRLLSGQTECSSKWFPVSCSHSPLLLLSASSATSAKDGNSSRRSWTRSGCPEITRRPCSSPCCPSFCLLSCHKEFCTSSTPSSPRRPSTIKCTFISATSWTCFLFWTRQSTSSSTALWAGSSAQCSSKSSWLVCHRKLYGN